MQCKCCGRDLPLSSFEHFKTGTYRKLCWQCRWVLNGKKVRKRKMLKLVNGEWRGGVGIVPLEHRKNATITRQNKLYRRAKQALFKCKSGSVPM